MSRKMEIRTAIAYRWRRRRRRHQNLRRSKEDNGYEIQGESTTHDSAEIRNLSYSFRRRTRRRGRRTKTAYEDTAASRALTTRRKQGNENNIPLRPFVESRRPSPMSRSTTMSQEVENGSRKTLTVGTVDNEHTQTRRGAGNITAMIYTVSPEYTKASK